ncbi:UNVERIFIED_ORG: hypothetical protein M2348_003272 [Sphingomonas sp. R1F5B]
MTTVATRARRIADIEGFDIIVKQGGRKIALNENGILGPYPYEKMAQNAWTVADWKAKRFEAVYPDFTCDVLLEDGSVAASNTSLVIVRESYSD